MLATIAGSGHAFKRLRLQRKPEKMIWKNAYLTAVKRAAASDPRANLPRPILTSGSISEPPARPGNEGWLE
jgi:hypothetical protein